MSFWENFLFIVVIYFEKSEHAPVHWDKSSKPQRYLYTPWVDKREQLLGFQSVCFIKLFPIDVLIIVTYVKHALCINTLLLVSLSVGRVRKTHIASIKKANGFRLLVEQEMMGAQLNRWNLNCWVVTVIGLCLYEDCDVFFGERKPNSDEDFNSNNSIRLYLFRSYVSWEYQKWRTICDIFIILKFLSFWRKSYWIMCWFLRLYTRLFTLMGGKQLC